MKAPGTAEVAAELRQLVELSAELRQAMLARDPERIQELSARGDAMRSESVLAVAHPRMLADAEVGPLASRLRRLQESNRLLAGAFLKVYRQILRPAGAVGDGEAGGYGRTGVASRAGAAPLLIHQIG